MASSYFTSISSRIFGKQKLAVFDCRAFVVPKEDINNMFVWREQDATRNSIQSLARSLYSHNQCNNKNCSELQEMCFQKGINWNDCPTWQKRGRCAIKVQLDKTCKNRSINEDVVVTRSEWIIDNNIPIFSKDKNYVEQYI